jgi:hypothetical protein
MENMGKMVPLARKALYPGHFTGARFSWWAMPTFFMGRIFVLQLQFKGIKVAVPLKYH